MSLRYAVFLSSRMNSSRLPGKAMYPLKGQPCLAYCMNRLKGMPEVPIILLTTDKTSDDVLAEWTHSLGFQTYRGNETDLVDRYLKANDLLKFDFVIRATADCPFIGKELVELCLEQIRANPGYDFYTTKGSFPVGLDLEIMSAETLRKLATLNLTQAEKEHLTLRLYHDEQFKILNLNGDSLASLNKQVFTLDTIEDFRKLSLLAEKLGTTFTYSELANLKHELL